MTTNGGPLGFEDLLWKAADKLRGSMDASEYKHVTLGLVFLKYVSDAFTERRDTLVLELQDQNFSKTDTARLLDNRDEYMAEGIFWLPPVARWSEIQAAAKQTVKSHLVV